MHKAKTVLRQTYISDKKNRETHQQHNQHQSIREILEAEVLKDSPCALQIPEEIRKAFLFNWEESAKSPLWGDPTLKLDARHHVLGSTRANSSRIYLRERRGSDSCLQPPSLLIFPSPPQLLTGCSGTHGTGARLLGGQQVCRGVWCESQSPGAQQAAWLPPQHKHTSYFTSFPSLPHHAGLAEPSLHLEADDETWQRSRLRLRAATLPGPRMPTRMRRNQSSPMICCLLKCGHKTKPPHIRRLTSLHTVLN